MKTSHLIIGAAIAYAAYKLLSKPKPQLGYVRRPLTRTVEVFHTPSDIVPYDPPMLSWTTPDSMLDSRFFQPFTFADGHTEILRRCPGGATRSLKTGRCITDNSPYEGYSATAGDGGE